MTTYEYPGYDDDAELTKQMLHRIERMSKALDKLRQGWDSIVVEASGDNGAVELSVDHRGRLMSLSLADGCTQRYTNIALEELITATIRSAVAAAEEELEAVDESAVLDNTIFGTQSGDSAGEPDQRSA